MAGLALGFAGAAILIWDGRVVLSASGIALALLSGGLWAAYCVFRLVWKRPAGNLLARGCAVSALLCAALHLLLEPTILPGATNLVAIAIAGSWRSASETSCGIKASGGGMGIFWR